MPAPPVPVMPTTGVFASRAAERSESRKAADAEPPSSAVMRRARARRDFSLRPRMASIDVGASVARSTSQRIIISPIIPAKPMRWPSSGL